MKQLKGIFFYITLLFNCLYIKKLNEENTIIITATNINGLQKIKGARFTNK